MKQRVKSENELRAYNLRQFIIDCYDDDFKCFNDDFRKCLREKGKYNEDQVETKLSQVRQAHKGYRNFTSKQQELVEKVFDLPTSVFTRIRPPRKPAYIFISCMGNTCNLLYAQLKEHELVDEVSILFGDIDLFIRVYGSSEEIQHFINVDLYSDQRVMINHTRTYFSLYEKNWAKYPIRDHPEYRAPADRWKR